MSFHKGHGSLRTAESYKKQSELPVYKSLEFREKMKEIAKEIGAGKWMKGRVTPKEVRIKISNTHKKKRELNHLWKGGINAIHNAIRKSVDYKLWREEIFKRDNWTCQSCGKRGNGDLHADHIKPFAYYPELRFDIDNGKTLCKVCHRLTDTYGEGAKNMQIKHKAYGMFQSKWQGHKEK